MFNFLSYYGVWNKVHKDRAENNLTWSATLSKVDTLKNKSAEHLSKDEALQAELEKLQAIGTELAGNGDRRLLWLELFRAIN